MNDDDIIKMSQYSLSDTDINKLLPNVPIYTYGDLAKVDDIKQILPDRRCAFVLMAEQIPDVGHWVAIVKVNRNIIYFDPYGYRVDKFRDWVKTGCTRKILNMHYPHLSFLLNNAVDDGFTVSYSAFAYQDRSNSKIATCGRWVAIFVTYMLNQPSATLQKFYDMVMSNSERYDYKNLDFLVSFLTKEIK